MERLETAQRMQEHRMSGLGDSIANHPPIKEKPVEEIVSRLPGRLIEQSETRGSRTTYVVKFATEDYDEQTQNKFEILPSNNDKPDDVSSLNTVVKGGRPKTTKSKQVESSITRSKRIIKTPKRLLDTDSDMLLLKRTPTLNKMHKGQINENSVLELPEISICKIDEKDLNVELIVSSEFTVFPLEFINDENGKSKYSFRVSGKKMYSKDDASLVDSLMENQSGENDESVCKDSQTKIIQDDDQTKNIQDQIKQQNPVKEEKDGQNLESFIEDSNYLSKIQKKNSGQASTRKKQKKSQKDEDNNMKIESRTEIQTESSMACDTVKIEEIKESRIKLENDVNLSDQLEHDIDNYDDLDSELRDMDQEEEQTSELSHTASDIVDDIKPKSENKECQAPEPVIIKTVKTEKRNTKAKEKKTQEESRPKRKYTKRNAYSHDNTNYTVIKNEAGKRVFKCEFCGIEMLTGGNIRDHIRKHTNDKPFQCSTCGKRFKTDNNLRGHMVIHSDARPHVCDICGLAFKHKGLLKIHRRRHDPAASCFTCQICGKGFYTSTEVKKHLPTHTGERKYECEVCGKKFKQDSALVRHRVIHLENKPFNCDICGKSFSRKNLFRDHNNKYHSGEDNINTNIENTGQHINEIHVSFADEDAQAADQILGKDTLYVQFTQVDDGYQWPSSYDKDDRIVYQSLDIPTQHGEEIIIMAGSTDQQQSYQYHQV